MRSGTTAVVVLLFGLAWFGRSAWGGWFLADDSPSMDIYHLSTIYERWAHDLQDGHLPTWMPEFAAGYPAAASWMYGLWYPGLLLFAVLPASAAWTWTAILHMVLAGLGVHRLVHDETDDTVAATTAGLLFALSELLVSRVLYGHLNLVLPLAWAPWVFLHLRGVAAGRRWAGFWLVASAALGLLSGHVQVWFYVVPAALAYAVVVALRAERRGRVALQLGVAAVLVVALTAVQWLPTLELFGLSQRAPTTSADVIDFSAPGLALVTKLFPGAGRVPASAGAHPVTAAHELGATGGLLLVVLLAPALLRRRREDWFWTGVLVAGLLLAPGPRNALSELLNQLPPVRWARTPARALLLVTLAAAVLAGRGVAGWRRLAAEGPARLRRVTAGTAVAAALVGTAGAGVVLSAHGSARIGELGNAILGPAAVRAIVTSAVLAALALAVPLAATRDRRTWWALPALAVLGAVLGGAPPARTIPSAFFATDWAGMLPESMTRHRLHLLSGRMPNVERQGLRTLREICYVDARWFHEYMDDPAPARATWLDVAVEIEGIPRERVMTGTLGPDDLIGRPYHALGPGLVLDGARVETDDARVLRALDSGERALFLAAPAEGAGGTASRPVAGATVMRRPAAAPDRVVLDVESPAAGWLFVSEKHYPGWRAAVNGTDAPIHRANVMFRAVQVPEGSAEVVFTYEPRTVAAGGWAFLAGLLGLGGWTLLGVRRDGSRSG